MKFLRDVFRDIPRALGLGSFSITYLSRLLRFAFREHPILLPNLGLAFLSVILEIAAIASVNPLSTLAAGGTIQAGSGWARAFETVGIELTFSALLLYFVLLFALRLITNFLNQGTSVYLGKRVQADLSSRAFEKLVKDMSLREIDSKSAGHFISLAGDETARAGGIVIAFNQALAAALLASVYLAAMFYFSPRLGLGVVAFLLVGIVSLRGTLRRSQTLSARQLEESKVLNSVFMDTLNGLRSVRALSAESFLTSKYDQMIKHYTRTHFIIDVLAYSAKLVPALILLVCLAFATLAGYLSVAGPSELAAVVTALALFLRFFPAAGQVLSLSMRLLTDLRAASDVTHLLDSDAEIPESLDRKTLEGEIETLELRQTSFRYKPTRPVLRDFSVLLQRGRSYALVGPSGSGKTTIFDLLLGFYAPDSGDVFANGIAIREIDRRHLRTRITLVGQQVTILNDTVANNIRFGSRALQVDVKAACRTACIDEYIEGLPQGYDTVLSYQGNTMSGGQRQRIAIARALLRNPSVLLLDESTAGLDADTRDQVIQNILNLYGGRIVVFATHDKDLVSRVDEVISISDNAGLPIAQDGAKGETSN